MSLIRDSLLILRNIESLLSKQIRWKLSRHQKADAFELSQVSEQ